MKKILSILLVVMFFVPSCLAEQLDNIFRDDLSRMSQAKKLVEDYLEGQKNGESAAKASEKYGSGVIGFYGLKEYRLERTNSQSLVYRVQAANQLGGVVWSNVGFTFSYDAKRETYGGLRIHIIVQDIN